MYLGRRQDPNGAYTSSNTLICKAIDEKESPVIKWDRDYSRDFTYIG